MDATPETVNPTAPSAEAVMAASALINRRIKGFRGGQEKRDIARESDDPALRHAALVLDAFVGSQVERLSGATNRQAGASTLQASVSQSPTLASPAVPPVPESPRPRSWASMYAANRRPRNLNGSYTTLAFVREVRQIGAQVRDALEAANRPLGVIEAESKREGAE